jgi:hypothetical protein
VPRQSTAIGGGGSHDRHRGSHNGPGKNTELIILEPATATILGLLYSRIQVNSEKHKQEIKVISISKICNVFCRGLQYAW